MADTDKVHSGSSGNRTVSLLLPAKQPLSQPSPGYEKLAGLRQCLIMTAEQKKRSKDDNNAVGGGKKMRKSSRPGNMLRQGAGQAIKNLSSFKTGQPDSPCQCQEMNSLNSSPGLSQFVLTILLKR